MKNLNNKLADAVAFARFCLDHQIEPKKLGFLIQSSTEYYNLQCRLTGKTNPRMEKRLENLTEQINAQAQEIGFTPDFSNPYPTLTKNDRTYHFPF